MEPYYKKRITPTDLDRFVVPENWLGSRLLPGDPRPGSTNDVQVFDDALGRAFTVRLKIRPLDLNKERYYRKPEFMAKGWGEFVAVKGLNVGDTICFVVDVGNRITVQVIEQDKA